MAPRFETFESHPGWWCVYDRKKRGWFPCEWASPIEALAEAKRWLIEAAQGKRELYLVLDDDKDA
jgi:hypothetical protein